MTELAEVVRAARARTGVPGVAAGLHRDGAVELCADGVLRLGLDEPVRPETPFRVASISKPFTAALALSCLPLDRRLAAWLSHSAGLRCEAEQPLPAGAGGLFSYANSGYWAAGREAALACGMSFEDAMRARILAPLGLASTGYDEPPAPARGHVQESETGQRPVDADAYPRWRRPSGGLWSTVGDLLAFAAAQLAGASPAFEPRSEALGARYGLGWWVRRRSDGSTVLDHEGSVAGYQSLLLLVPDERLALAVLTNSWRGSGLIRHVVEELGLLEPAEPGTPLADDVSGRYELDAVQATVEPAEAGLAITEVEVDPVTGARRATRAPVSPLGRGVYGFAGGTLMSHRVDFPRPGLARIGWVVLPRVEP